jgi:hypothetical protein
MARMNQFFPVDDDDEFKEDIAQEELERQSEDEKFDNRAE